ncbi:MAG: alginate export family protein, partial [Methylocystis silviterrae]|uniref:alginate export family protein n=1 Tax=Methylocystis silviterrae TaxID=2743612 RepID=UPI003C716F9F
MTRFHHKWLRPAIASALAISAGLAAAEESGAASKPSKTGGSKIGAAKIDGAKAGGKDDALKVNKPAPGAAGAPAQKTSYYVKTRGYRLDPAPDVPAYVRTLGKTYKEFEGIDWLDVGLDARVRFESRQNDYRPWTDTATGARVSQRRYFPDSLWLSRTRAYFGVKEVLDPLRFAVEYEDARAFNSVYQLQGQDINQNELIQAYAELYFKDALGKDDLGNNRPLIMRAGRFHLELLDRR